MSKSVPPPNPAIPVASVADPDPVRLLFQRTAAIVDDLGISRERRKFVPHVTVARLKRPDERRLASWVTNHALYRSESFVVDDVCGRPGAKSGTVVEAGRAGGSDGTDSPTCALAGRRNRREPSVDAADCGRSGI